MAILFAGNETDSFTYPTSYGTGGSGTYNANFCRNSISVTPSNYATASIPTAQSSVWVHFDYLAGGTQTALDTNIVQIRSTTYGTLARLRWATGGSVSTATVIGEVYDGANWVSFGQTTAFSVSLVTVDVNLSISPVGGFASWYVNGVQIGSYTGDTQGFAATNIIDSIRILGIGGNSAYPSYFSQVIVADESTLGMKAATLYPTGAGALADWTGTYADVDEFGYNDSDYISAPTENLGELFAMSDLSATAQNGYLVKAVVQSGRAAKGFTGPQNLQYYMYSNGTVSPSPNLSGITNSMNNLPQYIWAQDPSTGADWTLAAVNALQAGFKSII